MDRHDNNTNIRLRCTHYTIRYRRNWHGETHTNVLGLSCLFVGNMEMVRQPLHTTKLSVRVGLFFGMSCMVYWFGAIAVGFSVGVAILFQTLNRKHRIAHILRSTLAGIVSFGFIGLCTFRMLLDLWMQTRSFEQMNASPVQTISLLGQSLPIYDQLRIHNTSHFWSIFAEHPSTPPILLLGVFGLILPYNWKARLPWLFGWIVSLWIPTTGAFLIGQWTVPTGQGLLQWIFPLLLRCESPERMMIAPTLMSLIVGWHAIRSLPAQRFAMMSVVIGGVLAFYPSLPSAETLRVSSFVVDDFRLTVAKRYPGGMIDVPLSRSENTYVQQLFHKQPLLGGPGLNRVQSEEHKTYCTVNGLLSGLIDLDRQGFTNTSFSLDDVEQLIADGFATIIFDPNGNQPSKEQLEQWLGSAPSLIEERTGLTAYQLSNLTLDK